MATKFTDPEEVRCSFCGKSASQVKKMIAGNGVYICNEDVDLAKHIIDDELRLDSLKEARELPKPMEIKQQLCLLYTSPSPRDSSKSRMPSSA